MTSRRRVVQMCIAVVGSGVDVPAAGQQEFGRPLAALFAAANVKGVPDGPIKKIVTSSPL